MATVNLYLKDNKANKTAIRAVINDGRKFQIKLYSGVSVNPKHWSKKSKGVLSADPDCVQLNRHLKEFKSKALDVYLEAKRNGVKVTTDYMKKHVWPEPIEQLKLWEVWEVFLESKKHDFKARSISKFKTLEKHLKEFETFRLKPMELAAIDDLVLEEIQAFFFQQKQLNTQSTDKYIGLVKIFLNWSLKHKYSEGKEFQNFKSVKQPDSLKVILTNDEIDKIESLELVDKAYLKNARELLILSCYTGLRYSDYSRVNKQHLKIDQDGMHVLQIRQQKTNKVVEIPLNHRSHDIVNSLINGMVHPISNQKMNDYLKELCELAGIDELFEVYTYRGKHQSVQTKPKYRLVTTHTGRRTFATLLLLNNVTPQEVMEYTGHSDYKSFSKYVNIPKATQKRTVKEALLRSYMQVSHG